MALVLSILRCPDSATPGTRTIPGGDFTLGRAEGCDWVLADPDRLLSRRHCTLEFRDGFWGVRDLSANGTFVNASAVPVGKDMAAPLEDGDRLRLGGYEFEVRIEGASAHPGFTGSSAWAAPASTPYGNPLAPPPFGAPPPPPPYGGSLAPPPFGEQPYGQPAAFRPDPRTGDAMRDPFAGAPDPFVPAAPILPADGFVPVGDERALPPRPDDRPPPLVSPAMDFDPFADSKLGATPGFPDPFGGPTRADHSPSTSDAFVPPAPRFGGNLPENWNAAPTSPPAPAAGWQEPDWDALLGDLGPGGAPKPAAPATPDPLAQPVPSTFAPRGETPFAPNPPPADPFAAAPPSAAPPGAFGADPFPAASTPAGFGGVPNPAPSDPFASAGLGAPAPVAPPPADRPAPAGTGAPVPADPFAPAGFGAAPPAAPVAPAADPFAEQPGYTAAPSPPPRPAPAPVSAPSGPGDAAGLDAFLRGAGLPSLPPGTDPDAALHAAGVALRAAVGGIRALLIARADVKRAFRIEQTMLSRNNNPVKFAATDEASVAALITQPNGAAAVEETVADLTLHQVAALAATQAAARALLDRVSPAEVEAANPGGGGLLGGREKALWTAYKGVHAKLIEQFEDDFDSAFGRAFARAYEEAAKANKGR